MDELMMRMEELLAESPEMTFFEACAELVKKGELNYAATEDPGVHAYLYQLYQRAKNKANLGRANKDM